MNHRTCFVACLLPMMTAAAPSSMDDYARGMTIEVAQDRPVVEVLLPDALYQGITRVDLADVRVFNGEGNAVPHAVCESDVALAPLVTRQPLNVFPMQSAVPNSTGTQVEVHTAGGTQVQINESAGSNANVSSEVSGHVMDARAINEEVRAVEFDWTSPDGASEARVQIQSSDDLDAWQTVVSGSALLQVTSGPQQLRRQRVPLPQRRYQYLRVQRVDGGPALRIDSAQAEAIARAVSVEPVWFSAVAEPGSAPRSLAFSSQRLAPIIYARLVLPQTNSSMRVTIQSRDTDKASWRTHWNGEFYSIVANGERRVSPPAEFPIVHDKYWRVEPTGAGAPFYETAVLELGYRPAKLRFLTQGNGPFTLAYGSRRAEPAPVQSCDRLLADVNAKEMADLVAPATASVPRSLGGDTALKPLPKKTPVRLMVFWGVLILGVGLLIVMAMSLFRRLRQPLS